MQGDQRPSRSWPRPGRCADRSGRRGDTHPDGHHYAKDGDFYCADCWADDPPGSDLPGYALRDCRNWGAGDLIVEGAGGRREAETTAPCNQESTAGLVVETPGCPWDGRSRLHRWRQPPRCGLVGFVKVGDLERSAALRRRTSAQRADRGRRTTASSQRAGTGHHTRPLRAPPTRTGGLRPCRSGE